jgi:hypothetical protein
MHFFIGIDDISYPLFSRGSGIFSDSLLGYGRSLSLDEVPGEFKTEISLFGRVDLLSVGLFKL